MAEWQLPKLHTRVRFPSPAPLLIAGLGLALGCAACAGLKPLMTQRLRWIPVAPPLADLDSAWDATHELMAQGLRIKAMNSAQDLHLLFVTDDRGLQQQFSGQFGQSVLLEFNALRSTHGLRIDFKPKASFSLLADPIDTVDRVVTLLGPADEGYPRTWTDGSEGVELSAVMSSGTLVYEVRLPLVPETPGAFGLDVRPGEKLSISIEAARLGPQPLSSVAYDQDSLAWSRPLRFSEGSGAEPSAPPNGSYFMQWSVQLAQAPEP